MKLILLEGVPVFQQLQLEEALLRLGKDNYCLINTESPPAIVMGISAQPEELICKTTYLKNPLPLVRRYSGGGTVVIDPSTVFISWIYNHASLSVLPFPKEVMQWNYEKIKKLFQLDQMELRENDYVIGDRKCGGNAQYFIKDRMVHHTSFLWDFDPKMMDYLLVPKKMPGYRTNRPHVEFLTTLQRFYPCKSSWLKQLEKNLIENSGCALCNLSEISFLNNSHRKMTTLVEWI